MPILVMRNATLEGTEPKRTVGSHQRAYHHISPQARLILPIDTLRTCQRLVADNTLVVRATPEIAYTIFHHRTDIAQRQQGETGCPLPQIGCTVLQCTNPKSTVIIEHQALQGVVGQGAALPVLGAVNRQLMILVDLQQTGMIRGHPQITFIVFNQVRQE